MFKSNLIISLSGLYKTQADIVANEYRKHPSLVSKDVRVITEDGKTTVYVVIKNPLFLVRLFHVFFYGVYSALAFVNKLGYEPEDASAFFDQHIETYNSWEELG